jgi:hypothetical protein
MVAWPHCFGPVVRTNNMMVACAGAELLTLWQTRSRRERKEGAGVLITLQEHIPNSLILFHSIPPPKSSDSAISLGPKLQYKSLWGEYVRLKP